MNIKLLDQNTINKIAAGEVIERPASVVKELVENAIDAKATAITIEIKEGGISFIRITDNGSGIEKDDVSTAFLRHSTSKIKEIEDLFTVKSLGFRGEALSSIAAVSKVEVITKTRDNLTGIRYIIEGGQEQFVEEIGCPEGTTIIVRQLFYNTPVRRKFLKTVGTEAGYVGELINKLALSHPEISFKFIYNNVKLHTSGNNELKDVIYNIFGKETTKSLLEINYTSSDLTINGYIGKPENNRSNRNYENYYINGRYIKSKVIQNAIEEGYKTYLPMHKYPFTCFKITIKSELIDVNVHPTKMELRFNNNEYIYNNIIKVIKEALHVKELIPEISLDKKTDNKPVFIKEQIPEPFEKNRLNNNNSQRYQPIKQCNEFNKDDIENKKMVLENDANNHKSLLDKNIVSNSINETKQDFVLNKKNDSTTTTVVDINKTEELSKKGEQIKVPENLLSKESVPFHQIIGQLFNTYWIIEFKDKFYIIDQHAAHERILYEKIINDYKTSKVVSQELLQPIIFQVTLKERERLKNYIEIFIKLGFEIEPFGNDSYAVRAIPYIFNERVNPNYFLEILDLLSNDDYSFKNNDIILEKIASMACKAAIKANDKLTLKESNKLIEQLLSLENPYTCPHGRPTIISMTKYELEKKFKRIQ